MQWSLYKDSLTKAGINDILQEYVEGVIYGIKIQPLDNPNINKEYYSELDNNLNITKSGFFKSPNSDPINKIYSPGINKLDIIYENNKKDENNPLFNDKGEYDDEYINNNIEEDEEIEYRKRLEFENEINSDDKELVQINKLVSDNDDI